MPSLPFKLETAKSCSESWEGMKGGASRRHCDSCNKEVHDFARMSARQIEDLIHSSKTQLCARITRRADNSLVTLDPIRKAPIAATIALAFAGAAAAQTPSGPKAELTGKLLLADGSGPAANGIVTLESNGQVAATAKTDLNGDFRIVAPPGTYDIRLRQNVMFGTGVLAANLHEGVQSLQPMRTHFGLRSAEDGGEVTVTVGELIAKVSYPVSYVFKHPWRYMRHLLSRNS